MGRLIPPRARTRGSRSVVLATAIGMLVAFGSIAGAVHSGGSVNNDLFELGPTASPVTNLTNATNIVGNQAAGPDWNDLCAADSNGDIVKRDTDSDTIPDALELYGGHGIACIDDALAVAGAVDDTVFASSNKNGDAVDSWNWDTGNVPVKDDLSNVYGFAIEDGGDLIVYAGLERLSPNGDSHVDIEFTQQEVVLDKEPPCGTDGTDGAGDGTPCEFDGIRTDNDIIVSLDYTKGGALGSLEIRKWQSGAYVPVVTLTSAGCNVAFNGVAADAICGFTNEVAIAGGDWDSYDSHAAVISTLPANAFAEFGVNVNEALGLSEVPCFSTINAHTRSSQSFTAELKDFASARFELCAPSTDLSISADVSSATYHAGDTVTLTYTEANDGIDPLHPPTSSTLPGDLVGGNGGWVQDDNCSPILHSLGEDDTNTSEDESDYNEGDTDTDNVLDPEETWTFECSYSASTTLTHEVIAHGIDKRFDPDVDVTYCEDDGVGGHPPLGIGPGGTGLNGAGQFCDPDERATITITVINPSTSLVQTVQADLTFTYYETNDEPGSELTEPTGGWVTDDNCSPVTGVPGLDDDSLPSDSSHNIGDSDNDNKLDGGETWVFECTKSTTEGADFSQTNTATGHGIDSLGFDVTYCTDGSGTGGEGPNSSNEFCDADEQDAVTVTITHASPNPSPLPSPS